MTIDDITDRLRSRFDAPDRLTPEFLDEQMAVLEGWHESAASIAREQTGKLQENIEALVQTMTEEEQHAAKRVFATVYPLIVKEGMKEYEKIDPPSHEVAREEVVGLAWAVFLRCLATYDGRSHLTTWLTIDSRSRFRSYLLRIRDRDDTSRHHRARRKVYQLQRRMLTEEGRMPTREEYEEAVLQVNGIDEGHAEEMLTYLLSKDIPKRLDRPMSEDGSDLYTITPADDRAPKVHAKDVGERLAKKLGKEQLWEKLTAAQN